MQRIVLFLITNLAIMVVLSITLKLFGVEPYLTAEGLNLKSLLAFAAVFGFGGAFISLALSKWMAKRSVNAQVITNPQSEEERWLLAVVGRQAQAAGIRTPEVAIYASEDVNAFATGMSKNNALVAVSSGLLTKMDRDAVEAVLGHEISHVANGDMVTLTLIQGVVNTFVIFLARVVGYLVDKVVFKTERGNGPAFYIITFVAELFLGILASLVVMWFSRQREFRADSGGARLSNRNKMIHALQVLQASTTDPLPTKMAALGISAAPSAGWKKLFTTHPPLEERIAALQQSQ